MTQEKEPLSGYIYALSAFTMWGFLPLYMVQMLNISPWVISFDRMIMATIAAAIIGLIFNGKPAFRVSGNTLLWLGFSAICIGVNWTIFAYGISKKMLMEAALGYFINPLVSVIFGIIFFKEKMDKYRIIAIGLACVGVLNLIISADHFPIFALSLAVTFAAYGALRKKTIVDPAIGLFYEGLLLIPIAFIGLYFCAKHSLPILGHTKLDMFWLFMSGPFTAIPLTLFSYGARRLKLSTIGMLQYIAPSIGLIISIIYGEHFGIKQAITFGFIWAGLAVYSGSELKKFKA